MFTKLKFKNYLKKANSLFEKREYDEALAYYKKVFLLDKYNLIALYKIAYIYYIKKEYNSSIKILKDIVYLNGYSKALLLLGRIYGILGDFEEGLKFYSLFLDNENYNNIDFFDEFKFFADLELKFICKDYIKFYSFSVKICELFLSKFDSENNFEFYLKFLTWECFKLFDLKLYSESLLNSKKLLNLNKENPLPYLLIASNLLYLKEYHESLIYLDDGLKIDSEDILLNQTKGQVLYCLNNLEDSNKYFKKALSLCESSDSYYFISKIYFKEKKFKLALRNIDRAIKREYDNYADLKDKHSQVYYASDYFDLYWYKSLILFKLSQFDEANKIIDCLLEKEESAKNYCLKAKILYDMKDYENAITFADKALYLNPDCRQAIELKEKIENLK